MTTLKTFTATVNGKDETIEQVHGGESRQDILYKYDGHTFTADDFWKKDIKNVKGLSEHFENVKGNEEVPSWKDGREAYVAFLEGKKG